MLFRSIFGDYTIIRVHLICDWACPVDVSLIWNVIMKPLFLFSLLFFVWLLLFALLCTLWRSYICCNGRLIKFIKGLLRFFGESIVILLYIKRGSFASVCCVIKRQ